MFYRAYEELVRYASTGPHAHALSNAKEEYIAQTGELFESDPSFERRLSLFLEWYVLDRRNKTTDTKRLVESYLEDCLRDDASSELIVGLTALVHARASLFEFRRQKGEFLQVVDLLTGEKLEVLERRHALGLAARDIFEARLVPYDDRYRFTENSAYFPVEVRTHLLHAARLFRKKRDASSDDRVRLLHQLAYSRNRAERYRHVPATQIFAAQQIKL